MMFDSSCSKRSLSPRWAGEFCLIVNLYCSVWLLFQEFVDGICVAMFGFPSLVDVDSRCVPWRRGADLRDGQDDSLFIEKS